MNPNYAFQVRVTGVLIEDGRLLLVKQKLSEARSWSLPGGRLERGETLEQGVVREIKEETGLDVRVERLLYLCDAEASGHELLHVTFALVRTGGEVTLPTNEHDANPIHDVRFVPIGELTAFGFSERFRNLAEQGFPGQGSYMGDKRNIGLGI